MNRTVRRVLLGCGIAASALSVAEDALAGALTEGYSFTAQSMSELGAVGAPTRPLIVPANLTYDALMIAFGAGVWSASGASRWKRATAAMIVGSAGVSAVWQLFPMRMGEPPSPANVAFGAASVLLFMLAILLAAIGYRGWFRVYSILTLAAYAGLTGWGFLREGAGTEGEMSTGAQERTMVAGYLLWVVALAVMLLRAERRRGLAAGGAAETAA
jgi:hypothetical protein